MIETDLLQSLFQFFYCDSDSSQAGSVTRGAGRSENCGEYCPDTLGFRQACIQNNHMVLDC